MKATSQFSMALGSYRTALGFMNTHKLNWVFVFPAVLMLLLLFVGINWSANLEQWIEARLALGDSWWEHLISWAFEMVFWLFFALVYAFYSGFVVLILLSPVLAYLSERVANIVEGRKIDQSWNEILKNAWRAIVLAISNMWWEMWATLVFVLLGMLPLIGWVLGPVGLVLVSAYFFGFSFIDYYNERLGRGATDSRKWVAAHKPLAVGAGLPMALLLVVPIAGPLVACFVVIVGAVAGTLSMHRYHTPESEF